jgi:hypothetical protein
MAEAKRSADWDAPAALWALWAEIHRDNKQRSEPFTEADIHPFLKAEAVKPRPISEMRDKFRHG